MTCGVTKYVCAAHNYISIRDLHTSVHMHIRNLMIVTRPFSPHRGVGSGDDTRSCLVNGLKILDHMVVFIAIC